MSYNSESVLPKAVALVQIRDIVGLLGYKNINDSLDVPGRIGSYFWYEEKDYHSYVGVELDIYRVSSGRITLTTRSRAGRSYWDLTQQNKTLKLIRDLLGGDFTTDAGRNRYWRPDAPPPRLCLPVVSSLDGDFTMPSVGLGFI
jgi:hypothetical protein